MRREIIRDVSRVTTVFALGLFTLSCTHQETTAPQPQLTGKVAATQPGQSDGRISFEASFPLADQQIAKDTANRYITAYGCAQKLVKVTVEAMPAPKVNTDGSTVTTRAVSSPGRVVFNESGFPQTSDDLGNITIHEMTHACQEDQPKLFAKPITLSDGAVARGSQGFGLLVTLPSGEETKFNLIEEGTAEALASEAKKGYTVQDGHYFQIGKLTRDIQSRSNITPQDLAHMQQTDDVEQFVQRASANQQPFEVNLLNVVSDYQTAYDS